jgi:hypothetical protein
MPVKDSIRLKPRPYPLINRDTIHAYLKKVGKPQRERKRIDYIAKELMITMRDFIHEDDEGVKLPYNMGILVVKRFKSKVRKLNRRKTVELKQRIYHQNLHSFGQCIKISWIKLPLLERFRFIKGIYFRAQRELARKVSASCFAGKLYKEIPDGQKYASEMLATDLIQQRYEEKLSKRVR